MKKKHLITGIISAAILGTCSLPFLPITQHVYLKSYEKKVALGQYKINIRIILSENRDNNDMRISGYFEYPATELKKDGCYIEVSVEIEGHTTQKYPANIIGTINERNFPIENSTDSSVGKISSSEEIQRLTILLYNEPLVDQLYVLKLKPTEEKYREVCTAIKIIKHKVRRVRASMYDAAMSV